MTSQARSDDELLVDVGAGDQQAFATLFDRIVGAVFTEIWEALHDTAQADAVAEEAFVEVWRQAARFEPSRTPAVTWILDLAHELAAEHNRRDESRFCCQPSRPLRSAIADLTDPQQRAIELAFVAGSSQHEIAARLDAPVATVQALLRNGLLHLRTGHQAGCDATGTD